ncbi:hypothetical protein E1200_29835 [Actinomadura sp. GC306]|uniref:hypothetical protein n=1 Tax=Actinomadura sp. GC306 TaxID=2530367 RepID=UPI00105137E0|nr:hypothetical protein [Actinomadura sp. GC306]TDC60809.1 hypothetical protein E1200_29835 [Actinomadura sp. GC306]
MTALIVMCFLLAAVFFALGCMDQRKLYWKLTSWQYRRPEANEPSDAAYALNRFGMFLGAVMMLVLAAVVNAADASSTYSTAQVRSVASSAASELDQGTQSGIGSSYRASSDVYDAVNEHGGGNVKIRSVGGGEYELTNRDGENPVCLTVTVDNDLNIGGGIGEPWSHSVSTSVNVGSC